MLNPVNSIACWSWLREEGFEVRLPLIRGQDVAVDDASLQASPSAQYLSGTELTLAHGLGPGPSIIGDGGDGGGHGTAHSIPGSEDPIWDQI
jgi:hypothetical protein